MTATEVLRRLLDERGVEWMPVAWNPKRETFYHAANGVGFCADEYTDGVKIYTDATITPEQAIAATLGSCNCSDNCTDDERTETCEMEYVSDWMSWHCKSCDHMDMAPRNPKPRYCKWCGRKVADE